jgi:HK97 family phage portal protein
VTFFGRIGTIVRATVDSFRHAANQFSYYLSGRSQINYSGAVGDGGGSSIVVACVNQIWLAFTEAPVQVRRRTEDGWQEIPDHPLVELLWRPNPHMSGRLFAGAFITSLRTAGNAYIIKVRSQAKRPVELWPVPPHLIEPVWEGNDFITAYRYFHGQGEPINLHPDDVIHVRMGIDPNNTRKGPNQLQSLYREIFTDTEAGEFTSQILANLGVPGVIISPDGDSGITQADADAVKTKYDRKFGGDGRGGTLVMTGKTKVSVLTWTPEQLNLEMLRRIPEERICAILQVPPIVAHLGAGLDQATYSNYEQARSAFVENTIIPLWALIADEWYAQLLPEFGPVAGLDVHYDTSDIRILQEDENAKHERARHNVAAGIWTVNEARVETGRERDDKAGDVYLRQAGYVEVGWGQAGRTDAVGQNPNDPMAVAGTPALRVVRALPPAESKVAGDDHADRLAKLRRRLEPAFEKAVADSLEAQAGRVARRLGRKDAKAPDPDDLLPTSEDGRLAAEWRPHYTALIQGMWPILNEQLSLDVDFQLDDPAVTLALEAAGERIGGINAATREALAKALQEGAEAGEGIGQLAARVRQVVEESYKGRAETISRTELALAAQQATVGRYKAAGITKVRVFDGDEDEACAGVNGSTQSLDWAESNPISHPRCTRAFAAIVEGTEEAA